MVEIFIKLWCLKEKEKRKIKSPSAGYESLFHALYLIWGAKKTTKERKNTQLIGRTTNKMYKAPTEEDFDFITSFWRFEITKVPKQARNASILAPYYITARNRHRPEQSRRLFDFKMSNNHDMVAVMHFGRSPDSIFKSRTYEETLTILSIKEIIAHVKSTAAKKFFFHSNHEFVLEAMFTVEFERYTIVPVGNNITSVCAQKTI